MFFVLQYKIPQDVERADKILGPLTLKQLIIVVVGGGVSYGIFLIMSERFYLGVFDYFWIIIPLLISLAFAFLRINDVSFLKWLLLLFEYGHNARKRRWDKTETARLHFAFVTAKTETKEKKAETTAKNAVPGKKKFSSLEEITYLLDHSTNFSAEDKKAPDDHDDDHSLHLSAEEKARHEERLEKTLAEPKTEAAFLAPPSGTTAPSTSVPEAPEASPVAPAENASKAVDTLLTPAAEGNVISFHDLRQGGQISFS